MSSAINFLKNYFPLVLSICLFAGLAVANLSLHNESTLNLLLLELDSDGDGSMADEDVEFNSVVMGTARAGLDWDTASTDTTISNWGQGVFMTAVADVTIPDCTASTLYQYVAIVNRDDTEQISAVPGDASDQFVLSDSTALTAGNELDLGTGFLNRVVLMCLETNKVYVYSEVGTATDGGAAD